MTSEMIIAIIAIVRNCLFRYAFEPSLMAVQIAIIFSFPLGYFLTERTRKIAAITPATASEVVRINGSKAKLRFLLSSSYEISSEPPRPLCGRALSGERAESQGLREKETSRKTGSLRRILPRKGGDGQTASSRQMHRYHRFT